MEDFFTKAYESSLWGENHNSYYKGSSGNGSTIKYNLDYYIPFLRKYILSNNIKTIVDLGSGDFVCGSLIYDDLDIAYTGYEIYKKVVEYSKKKYLAPKYTFINLDFYNKKEQIKDADLCIIKDVLMHWKNDEIYNFLDYITQSKKFQHILIANCYDQKEDNPPDYDSRYKPLSADFLPLKKYNPKKLGYYNITEISVIR